MEKRPEPSAPGVGPMRISWGTSAPERCRSGRRPASRRSTAGRTAGKSPWTPRHRNPSRPPQGGRRWTGPPSKGAPVPGMPPGPGSMPGAAVPAGPSGKRDRPSPEPGSRRGSRCTRSGGRGAGCPAAVRRRKRRPAAAAVSTDKIRSLQDQDRIPFPSFLPSGAFFHGSMAVRTLSRRQKAPGGPVRRGLPVMGCPCNAGDSNSTGATAGSDPGSPRPWRRSPAPTGPGPGP